MEELYRSNCYCLDSPPKLRQFVKQNSLEVMGLIMRGEKNLILLPLGIKYVVLRQTSYF